MSKPVIWFLIGFGFLSLFLGLFGSRVFTLLGLASIGAGFYFGLGPDGILRKDQVVDTWAMLIENAQGKSEGIFQDTEAFIRESQVPSLRMERRAMAPGMVGEFMGKTRDFLAISDKDNSRMKPYQIFINSRDYGNNLDVSWFLTYKPSLFQSFCALLPYVSLIPGLSSDLDLFDQQDLRAYATNIHHCFLKAVTKLMTGANQDPSKIDRKSKGFLGIS
jgi:hypothetical protein